jgi:hypothetical protein
MSEKTHRYVRAGSDQHFQGSHAAHEGPEHQDEEGADVAGGGSGDQGDEAWQKSKAKMNHPPSTLAWHDLQWCLRRAPRQLLIAMKKHGESIIVAGGFIRSCVTNENINDIDCFCPSREKAREIAMELVENDEKRIHETPNALTLRGFRTPIQIIHRWVFQSPELAILSFDFTIARAAFWWNPMMVSIPREPTGWSSICGDSFYADLAEKRLIYCQPIRNEDAGGSILRVLKFYQRGYRIPLDSLGSVLARLVRGVDTLPDWDVDSEGRVDEPRLAKILTGLLREVDPNLDPRHIAHLPSESARAQQKEDQEGAEDIS